MRCHYLLILLIACGCGETAKPTAPPAAPAPAPGASPANPTTQPAAVPGVKMRTIQWTGFSFQAPDNWTVSLGDVSVAISSPIDFKAADPTPPVPVSLAIIPSEGPVSPAEMAVELIRSKKEGVTVESEQQITVSGRQGTKIVSTTSTTVNEASNEMQRSISVFVPLDKGVLAVQVQSRDQYVKPVVPQIDTIIASIKIE